MRLASIVGSLGVAALATGARAEDTQLYFSPDLIAEFTAPSGFDGLYAGVLFGPISSRMGNFNVGGADIRGELGGFIGWNQPIADGVVLGGEVQASIATDLGSSAYLRAMALARLGFAAGDNTLIYLFGGAGRMGEGWAFEAGLGAEVMVTDSMAIRLETAGIGQLGPVPNGNNTPAISALRITGGALWQLDGGPGATGFNSGPVTDFSGPYAGLNIGSLADPEFSFFDDYGFGWHLSRFEIGALAGYNMVLNDYVRVGVEGQAGVNFDTSGDAGMDLLALARAGIVPLDGFMAYAAGGVGLVEQRPAYALGGGLEYALWGDAALRAEAVVLGRLDGTPGQAPGRFPTTKVTIGTVWHFD